MYIIKEKRNIYNREINKYIFEAEVGSETESGKRMGRGGVCEDIKIAGFAFAIGLIRLNTQFLYWFSLPFWKLKRKCKLWRVVSNNKFFFLSGDPCLCLPLQSNTLIVFFGNWLLMLRFLCIFYVILLNSFNIVRNITCESHVGLS